MATVASRIGGGLLAVVLASAVLAPLGETSAQDGEEGVAGNSYVSPTFGYELTWDSAIWDAIEEESDSGYDLLALESDGATVYLEGVYFYQGDQVECIEGERLRVAEEFELADIDPLIDGDGEPVGGIGSDYTYAMFEVPVLDGEGEIDTILYLECRTLVPNSIVLIITGYIDPNDADFQTERVIELVEAIDSEAIVAPDVDEADLEGIVGEASNDINEFWDDAFGDLGGEYVDPTFISFTGPAETNCGDTVPGESGTFYCPADQTVYLDVEANLQEDLTFGMVFFQVLIAHEIGHHVQELLGLGGCTDPICGEEWSSIAIELQADCFAGAWMQDAAERGVIDENELNRVEIAVKAFMGDPIDTPVDDPDAHGTGDERYEMFMAGYTEGLTACGI